jgi:hypothetical protein
MSREYRILTIILSACTITLSGCSLIDGALPTATSTPEPPTATPEPAAARVNGEAILIVNFEEELQRYESAKQEAGIDLATLDAY